MTAPVPGMWQRAARMPLERSLPLLLGVQLTVIMALSVSLTARVLTRNAQEAVHARLHRAVGEVAASASQSLEANREDLVRLATRPEVIAVARAEPGQAAPADVAALRTVLDSLRGRRETRASVELWSADGVRLAVVGEASTPGTRPPLSSARRGAVTGPLLTHAGRGWSWTVAPVREAGVERGYLALLTRMGGRASALQQLRALTGEEVLLHMRNADNSIWVAMPSVPVPPPDGRTTKYGGVTYHRDDVGETIAEEALVSGSPLIAVMEVPLRNVRGRAMRAVRSLIIASLIFVAAGVVVAWWISRRIAHVDFARAEAVRLRGAAEAAREDAERASRAKSDFLAVMSHELRTPLNAIGGYAQLLEMGVHGPVSSAQHEALVRIQRNQAHLLTLINDVLNYSKLDAGKVDYRFTGVSMPELFEDLEPLVAPQIARAGLRLELRPCGAPIAVRADRDKLQQILLNLLTNAAKFTPRGGTIQVSCEADGRHAFIRVRDNGIGIAQDRLHAIFDPFFQADRALNRPTEGVGLGLAISRDLARGMDGDLTVMSTLGEGSEFTVTLPVIRAMAVV